MIEVILALGGIYGAYKLMHETPAPRSLRRTCRKLNKSEWAPSDRAYFKKHVGKTCKKSVVDREYGGARKECENDFAAGIASRQGYGADRNC